MSRKKELDKRMDMSSSFISLFYSSNTKFFKRIHVLSSRQVKSSNEEDSHLRTSDRTFGAIVAIATAASNALSCQLLDPSRSPIAGGNIAKHTYGSRRSVGRTMLGTQQEDSHLSAGNRIIRTILTCCATSRNTIGGQLFDPCSRPVGGRHVYEENASGWRRRIGGAIHAALQEDIHLGTSDFAIGAVHQRAGRAATRDPGIVQPHNPPGSPVAVRYITKDRCLICDAAGEALFEGQTSAICRLNPYRVAILRERIEWIGCF